MEKVIEEHFSHPIVLVNEGIAYVAVYAKSKDSLKDIFFVNVEQQAEKALLFQVKKCKFSFFIDNLSIKPIHFVIKDGEGKLVNGPNYLPPKKKIEIDCHEEERKELEFLASEESVQKKLLKTSDAIPFTFNVFNVCGEWCMIDTYEVLEKPQFRQLNNKPIFLSETGEDFVDGNFVDELECCNLDPVKVKRNKMIKQDFLNSRMGMLNLRHCRRQETRKVNDENIDHNLKSSFSFYLIYNNNIKMLDVNTLEAKETKVPEFIEERCCCCLESFTNNVLTFLRCGHKCCCNNCYSKDKPSFSKCPLCKEKIIAINC